MAAGGVVSLNHIARESTNIERLTKFYKEMFGFEEVETPSFGAEFKVVWMRLPSSSFLLHLIQRVTNQNEALLSSSSSVVKDPSLVRTGHHICFSISNFHSFLHTLKEKGNGLEIVSREESS
ncbi:hypothetical protein TSUD_228360 [Trifolium subterraneum]|uniref:Glyoxalase/fosfomycin resistance/dioxygenase domain-containing protein n=1 Tax=Trifolium subterraneum TaxID=3900 RepID=A0A2Z6LQF9_TRISU|nr:hypothetical protein TSUD_228360 [Trifolium subterraneum]